LSWARKISYFLLSVSNWRSYYYTIFLNRLIRFADDITVSGIVLKKNYGGSIIWHARDPNIFHSPSSNKHELKSKQLLGHDKAFIVGFIGTPRSHKGIEDLIRAMELLDDRFFLLVVGLDEGEYCQSLMAKANGSGLKSRSAFFSEQPISELVNLLTITDVIVVPQRKRAASYGQVPAKLFDAMLMAKPIIATNVYDIPAVINSCGWIVEPENPKQLAEAITYVFRHPEEALMKGLRAKKRYEARFSWDLMSDRLMSVFEKYEKV
jgi:glycosyltransferase involved in cell wall biosynthesis